MEQNIDDILKLLKDSVSDNQEQMPIEKASKNQKDISTEKLQAQLKDQYVSNASDATAESDVYSDTKGEYVIDSDFLNEALHENIDNTQDNIIAPDDEKEVFLSESTIERIEFPDNSDENLTLDNEQWLENTVFSPVILAEQEELEDPHIVEAENTNPLMEDNTEELVSNLKPLEEEPHYDMLLTDEDDDTDEEITDYEWELPEDNVDELVASLKPIEQMDEGQIYGEIISDDESVFAEDVEDVIAPEEDDTEQIKDPDISPKEETHETFLASMRRTGMDFTNEDLYNSYVANSNEKIDTQEDDFLVDASDDEVVEADSIIEEELDPSTINLMMQFCDKDELDETIGDKQVDEFLRQEQSTVNEATLESVANGKEYVDQTQNERIRLAYKKKRTAKLMSLIGCCFFAVISLIYEMLPIFGVRLSGALDYNKYPAVYALIGLQMVVFVGAIWHKELWKGLKRAFSLTPTSSSIIAIVLSLTVIYDVIIVIILAFTKDALPNMYNGIAVLMTAIAVLSEYLDIVSQCRAFGVYSSDTPKYTLIKETADGTVGAKMYGGGLESDKSIYAIKAVDFPNGFFRSMSVSSKNNKLMTVCIIPILVLGMIASVLAIIIGADAYASCAAFMLCVYALMPVVLVLTNSLPYAIACKRLSKRGSAFAGHGAVEKYCDCDVLVFNDLHMFKKCKTEDVGIAIYDDKVGYLVLGCIDALYSKIGGPMSGLQMNLPEIFKFDDVAIKRMTRNGIEAVVDKKHVLIVGDQSFMHRYGLEFPSSEIDNGRAALCVSLNGKVTAKLSVRYETEPVFEMLAERLYSEGITCAVQTFDPLICSSLISAARTIGESPISVIHGNAKDFCEKGKTRYNAESDGVVSCSSRLKLAEVEVWLKRITKVETMCQRVALGSSIFGAAMLMLLVSLGATAYVNQLHVLLYLGIELLIAGILVKVILPSKKYFTVDAFYSELERENTRKMLAEQRERAKQAKRAAK